MIGPAMEIASQAEILMIVGTSMVVYPAAGLINYVGSEVPKYYVDPKAFPVSGIHNLEVVKEKAGVALPALVDKLLTQK
jgi:NAD-dependent deacetylase